MSGRTLETRIARLETSSGVTDQPRRWHLIGYMQGDLVQRDREMYRIATDEGYVEGDGVIAMIGVPPTDRGRVDL
ncbi:MAG: hypothetical protein U1E62_11960 [Alsobacter sp.]